MSNHCLTSNRRGKISRLRISRTGLVVRLEKMIVRDFSKMFVKPRRAKTTHRSTRRYSPVDRRRQFQYFAFTENGYDERVSGFESGDAVINPFVILIACETAERLSRTRVDYADVVDAEDHITAKQDICPLNCYAQGSWINSQA